MHFILPVLMRKRITHDSWIQRQELLCTWSRTIWRLSQFSFALTILRSQSPAQIAYVTSAGKENTAKRLFSSTVFPEELQIFCAWQEKEPLNHAGSNWMKYIPLFLYSFRWNIEVSYYEQKTFWSFCSYMVRSRKGIEMLVNLINISYCAMKLLPYQEENFSAYRSESVQDFRFFISQKIQEQIFYVSFVKNIETGIKSTWLVNAIKRLVGRQGYHL